MKSIFMTMILMIDIRYRMFFEGFHIKGCKCVPSVFIPRLHQK